MKKKGYADVLIGLQFGDEGKARVVDMIAKNYDIIARFNGGANAGHTIQNKKNKIALKQIPSGIFYSNKLLYIGSGCVVNLTKLVEEIKKVESLGIKLENRLKISSQASIIQPHHIIIDDIIGKNLGTTKNGIGPAYADKAIRMDENRPVNIRIADLLDNNTYYFKVIKESLLITIKKYGITSENPNKLIQDMKISLKVIQKYVENDPLFLQREVENGARVLFEGAQSAMLDVSRGSIPFVTSSNTIAASAYVGGDLSVNYHRKTIGVIKAIMSRVGQGPFTSELGKKISEKYCMEVENGKPKHTKGEEKKYDIDNLLESSDDFKIGIALRMLAQEYGTGTMRPRRIGMFDLVQLIYAIKMNHVNELVINKCDLLNVYSKTKKCKIPIVVKYKLDKEVIDYVPVSTSAYYRTKPIIEYWDAFADDISIVRRYKLLPNALQAFVRKIEKVAQTKVIGIGVGPDRKEFIIIQDKTIR